MSMFSNTNSMFWSFAIVIAIAIVYYRGAPLPLLHWSVLVRGEKLQKPMIVPLTPSGSHLVS